MTVSRSSRSTMSVVSDSEGAVLSDSGGRGGPPAARSMDTCALRSMVSSRKMVASFSAFLAFTCGGDGNQTSSDAIRRHQTPSDTNRRNQTPSDAIRRHQTPSDVITPRRAQRGWPRPIRDEGGNQHAIRRHHTSASTARLASAHPRYALCSRCACELRWLSSSNASVFDSSARVVTASSDWYDASSSSERCDEPIRFVRGNQR